MHSRLLWPSPPWREADLKAKLRGSPLGMGIIIVCVYRWGDIVYITLAVYDMYSVYYQFTVYTSQLCIWYTYQFTGCTVYTGAYNSSQQGTKCARTNEIACVCTCIITHVLNMEG